ncbi:ssDNA-binding transcriptional regulator [Xylariaceae sp. FL1651]|nr:ssDNA-binding transcriptional regulator [Xylariaceae sp. FL1651]
MGQTKNLKRSRVRERSASSGEEEVAKSTKKSKTETDAATNSGQDGEGNSFWALGGTRRIVIQDFKGKTFVNIREYYSDAAGDLKPGKKGIMLSLDQYNTLLEALPAVNANLQSKGHTTPDVFASAPTTSSEPPAKSTSESSSKEKKSKNKKMNIEATSDEDEPESD